MPFLEEYDGTDEVPYFENPEGDAMDVLIFVLFWPPANPKLALTSP